VFFAAKRLMALSLGAARFSYYFAAKSGTMLDTLA
jgi:hypothetical protein